MANLTNLIGAATTAGGLIANLRGTQKPKEGTYAKYSPEVVTDVLNWGVQRDNLGLVVLGIPKLLKERNQITADAIKSVTYRTEGFTVPGMSIQTTDVRRYGIGPIQRLPVGSLNNNNVTLTIVADQAGVQYKFWMTWMNSIVNFRGRSDRAMWTKNDFDENFYEVQYRDDYAVDITTYEVNPAFDSILETRLTKAYPISIQDKIINWGNSGFVVFTVELAYEAIDPIRVDIPKSSQPQKGKNSNLMANLIKAGNAVQLISSMRSSGGLKGAAGIIGVGAAALANFGGVRR